MIQKRISMPPPAMMSHRFSGLYPGIVILGAMKKCLWILMCLFVLCSPTVVATPGEVPEGGTLRNAPLYGLTGDFRMLSELRGRPLIINVWASWCGPCRAEMGSLQQLANLYGGRQFNLIGISTDDDANAAYAFIMKSGITFDNYLDKNLLLENMLGASSIPLTLLIDAKGRVLAKVRGSRPWDSPEYIELIGKTFGVKLPRADSGNP